MTSALQLGARVDPERLAISAVIVALTLGVAVFLRYARRYLRDRRDTRVVDVIVGVALVGAVSAAGGSLVTLWGMEALVDEAVAYLSNPVATGTQVLLSLLALVVIYVGIDVLYGAIQRFVEDRDQISRHQAEVSFRVAQVTAYTAGLFVILGIWKVNLSGLLVGAGFLGIVFGLAAQQTLGALIAGFILMFSRPFEIGDWVEIGDNEGIVTDITIVNTRVQTFDGEYVMLPNDVVSGSSIVNRTRKGRLRIRVDVGVDYDTDIEEARDVARNALMAVDDILQVPQPQVILKRFGDSSIVLELRFWIDKPTSRRRWRARTAAIRAVKRAFDEAGIKIPFPQRELSNRPESEEAPIGGSAPEVEPTPDGS